MIWVLTDSRTGNNHQAIALAEKLAREYTIIGLEYNCLAKLPNFLLKYYPVHIKKEILRNILDKPLPDIIITAGRRTAALAFYLKNKLKKEIKLIQIMQPNLSYEVFEAVILPYHDQRYCEATKWLWQSQDFFARLLRQCYAFPRNDNIIPINGAINNVTAKFATAELELKKHYPELKEFIAVIIGGNNKKFNFTKKEAVLFSSLLKRIYDNQKIPFFISFSRRTPDPVKSIIKDNMPTSIMIYDPTVDIRHISKFAYREKFVGNTSPCTAAYTLVREDTSTGLTHKLPLEVEFGSMSNGYNPYIAMLAKAKYIISTADSISMCSEAASSGKPLYIFCPSNFNSSKHKIFVKKLVELKIARMFDKSVMKLEEYSYPPLDEAGRVAEIIKPLI